MEKQFNGPWKVKPDPDKAGLHTLHDHRLITDASGDWICRMRDRANQANEARLIAAAPELLDALTELVRWHGAALEVLGLERENSKDWREPRDLIRRIREEAGE